MKKEPLDRRVLLALLAHSAYSNGRQSYVKGNLDTLVLRERRVRLDHPACQGRVELMVLLVIGESRATMAAWVRTVHAAKSAKMVQGDHSEQREREETVVAMVDQEETALRAQMETLDFRDGQESKATQDLRARTAHRLGK